MLKDSTCCVMIDMPDSRKKSERMKEKENEPRGESYSASTMCAL